MFEFEWLIGFLLLPAPLLVRRLFPPIKSFKSSALKVPELSSFQQFSVHNSSDFKKWIKWLLIISWVCAVVALTRPLWVGEPIPLTQNARNIMLAVDLSGSMEQRDFRVGGTSVSRLAATKKVATDFILRREGDRIGLILFGDNAYVQVPLTMDRHTIVKLLSEAVLGLAGEKTAIGNAIALAVKRGEKTPDEKNVLVLMTDGAATAGVDVAEATGLAADVGLKIYTVGIGAISRGGFGIGRNDLDEPTLKAIAKHTGGAYFRARSTREFEEIYKKLDELEPVSEEQQWWRPRKELYMWPLAISMGALLLASGLRMRMDYE